MYRVIDNFLPKQEFKNLYELIMDKPFPWFYVGFWVDRKELEHDYANYYHFSHSIYEDFIITSPMCTKDIFGPIVERTEPVSIRNMSAHLYPRTPKTISSPFHTDIGDIKSNPIKSAQWTSAILYVNTNNGYTTFKDGTKVTKIDSIANRFVKYSGDTEHSGASCSDKKTRIIINYNYFDSQVW